MTETLRQIPAITLRGMTVLPAMIVHFDVSREKSVRALEAALTASEQIFLVTQRDSNTEEPSFEELYENGVIAEIKNIARMPHGLIRVMVEGLRRATMIDLKISDGMFIATVLPEEDPGPIPSSASMIQAMKDIFQVFVSETGRISKELSRQIMEMDDLQAIVSQISINLQTDFRNKQQILDADGLMERFEKVCELMTAEIEVARIRSDIQRRVKERVDKHQKEYLLREQLKVIQEELGEDLPMNEAEQYRERLSALTAPDSVKEKIEKEIRRFKSLGGNSAEASVSRTYIETLLDMPWDKMSTDREDLKTAAKILDEDHYGLEKVKERVLEFLAVRQLTKKGDSPILCLAGPPGTGKTSIARSVARALEKKYVRVSLGGVRDEAEIRGHRRTYIGAMPGRIAAGIRSAGVKNPLMLLDEVDKLSSSLNGDPSSALLEVLDSEQNCHFSDHYIEIPVDLSEVLFIATANDLHTVPRPLLDRMEVIEVSSYTENEKLHIAKEHLVSKQKEHHGLKDKQLTFTDRALMNIISGYTREAGVRQLERRIGEICRKAARRILEETQEESTADLAVKDAKIIKETKTGSDIKTGKDAKAGKDAKTGKDVKTGKETKFVRVKASNLEEFLGKPLYRDDKRNEDDEVGIVRGLAWTSVGGVTLQIEVNIMPGKGEFLLTGQLGDVMKESARTAISYIRSIADGYGIEASYFPEHDIHIHIPEGAVPKDGPSAGITMATAILSAITGRKVRCDVAMTGEITLRGRVLAIGGLKEKLLAAQNAGMKTVIIPEQNRRDIEDISEEITGKLRIVYAKTMEDVIAVAVVTKN